MSTIISLLLVAIGAILRYAIDSDPWAHLNEDTVGMILMVVGITGFLFSLLLVAIVGRTTSAIHDMQKDAMSHTPKRTRRN